MVYTKKIVYEVKNMQIKAYTPYVVGVVGHDFHLSLWQRVRLLFSPTLSVIFISDELKKEAAHE